MPKVSVVIPCYNHGQFLPETLDSLEAQTFTDYEVLVVNDGSTDATTVALLNSLDPDKARVLHTENRGVAAARNLGISEARGEYILPLDADDLIAPEYMQRAVGVLDAGPEVGIVYGERVLFGEKEGSYPLPEYDCRAILVDNCIYPAAFFRKCDWEAVGGYNEKMVHGWEDWDFWIALTSLGKQVVKITEPLFYYRVRSTSRDHSLDFRQKLISMFTIVMRHKRRYLANADLLISRAFRVGFRTVWGASERN